MNVNRLTCAIFSFGLLLASSPAFCEGEDPPSYAPDMGKLLATGGVIELEGTGGGGLTPWALITGYGTRDSYGASLHYTIAQTQDFRLQSPGVAVGLFDRVEVSYANQEFSGISGALNGLEIRQNIFGVKVRVLGDAVYDQDSWIPQVAIGAQVKNNLGVHGLEALGVHQATDLGAKDNAGTDYYISATKILLAESLLANLTLRATRANQFGLLGFGGDLNDSYRVEPEASLAYLITRKIAAGVEYRSKPHNLSIDDERGAYDAFVAWFPTRTVSLTVAYVNLGTIVRPFDATTQRGWYLSAQVGF